MRTYQRAVRPDVLVGVNCDLQTAGFHKLERVRGRLGRWSNGRAEATVPLAPPHGGPAHLRIEGTSPAIGGRLRLTAETAHDLLEWEVACTGGPFTVESDIRGNQGEQTLTLWGDRSWRPCDVGSSADFRVLGFVLHTASIEPYFETPMRPDVVVGVNCDAQLRGVHPLEHIDGHPVRWTDGGKTTRALLVTETPGCDVLRIEGWMPDLGGEIEIRAKLGARCFAWHLPANGRPFVIDAPLDIEPGEHEVILSSDQAWTPHELRGETDTRVLGFLLSAIALVPTSPGGTTEPIATQGARGCVPPRNGQRMVRRLGSELTGRFRKRLRPLP